MDLRTYFRKKREIEASIAGPDALIVSNETPDGGRSGVFTEVPRTVAAQSVAEGRARLATAEEQEQYYQELSAERARREQAMAAERLQINVISDQELRALRASTRSPKA